MRVMPDIPESFNRELGQQMLHIQLGCLVLFKTESDRLEALGRAFSAGIEYGQGIVMTQDPDEVMRKTIADIERFLKDE